MRSQTQSLLFESVPASVGGIDEAGRGPLAGPVVAAVVVLRAGERLPGVRDSKTLSPRRRESLAAEIRAGALAWAVGLASPDEIDRHNILNATFLAMARAVDALPALPDRIRVDGDRVPPLPRYAGPVEAVVRGDRSCPVIGAASIIAKVHRDQLMLELDARFPEYGFREHKGYPTQLHCVALERLGPCAAHRRSFAPVRRALSKQAGAA